MRPNIPGFDVELNANPAPMKLIPSAMNAFGFLIS